MLGQKSEHLVPLILSFAAGFVEAICFVGLFHTFTTFITGTLLILIVELVKGESGYLNKAIVFFGFFAFTILWIFLMRAWNWKALWRKPAFLFLEAILILVFAGAGVLLEPLESAGSVATLIVSIAAVIAMSLHSTTFFVLLNQYAPTHFMTGNLTNFSVGVVDLILGGRDIEGGEEANRNRAKFRIFHYPIVISLFLLGVVLGAAGFLTYGFVVLILPAAVLVLAAVVMYSIERARED